MAVRFLRRALVVTIWIAAAAAKAAAAPSPGVFPDRIVFGQSAALSGAAAELGVGMRRGIAAAFNEANGAGGVHGRRLELVTYDDAYEPEAAIANTARLINTDRVFALIGAVGTPTSLAAVPIAREAGVPFIAPFTGADALRDPKLANVVNVRASYHEETEKLVQHLIEDLGASRIAVLYQDDSFGRDGLSGVEQALERRNLSPVGVGSYLRNSRAVKSALLAIRAGDPQAIIIAGTYRPSAIFTEWARKLGLDAVIANISFVGTLSLGAELGPGGNGVVVSQVVPFPTADQPPVAAEYRAAMAAEDPSAPQGFVSLEGYIAGRLTVAVLEKLGRQPTREGFLEMLGEIGSWDISGFPLHYSADDRSGSHRVFLTRLDGTGNIKPVERLD